MNKVKIIKSFYSAWIEVDLEVVCEGESVESDACCFLRLLQEALGEIYYFDHLT